MSHTVVEAAGVLTISVAGEAAQQYLGLSLAEVIYGAWCFQVDFASFAVTSATAAYGKMGLGFYVDANNLAEVYRAKNNSVNNYEARVLIAGVEHKATLVTTDAAGKFQIVRKGNSIYPYYWDAGAAAWTLIGTGWAGFSCLGGNPNVYGKVDANVTSSCNFDNYVHKESTNSLYPEHILEADPSETGEPPVDTTPPINWSKAGAKSYYNKVVVEFTDRANRYATGTATADDTVDMTNFLIKEKTVKLDGLCTWNRAITVAFLLLMKSLFNSEGCQFKVGPKSAGIAPGVIQFITDPLTEAYNVPVRIHQVSESEDGSFEISSSTEGEIHDLVSPGSYSTTPPSVIDLAGDPSIVIRPTLIELPALYSSGQNILAVTYTRSTADAWAGASLYQAYSSGGSYIKKDACSRSGITGVIADVGSSNGVVYVDVTLDDDSTLASSADFDTFMSSPKQNMAMVRHAGQDIYIRFQTVNLLTGNTWRLTGLLYDTVGWPQLNTYGVIAVADVFVIYFAGVPFYKEIPGTDLMRTLYFKLPSFNFRAIENSLATVVAYSIAYNNLLNTPLAPFNATVGGVGIDSTGITSIRSGGDIAAAWKSQNRTNAGFNYIDPNSVKDDQDFLQFVLTIYKLDGVTVLRTVTQTSKSYTYTNALQITDGGPWPGYIFKVYQVGILNGPTLSFTVNIVP